MASTFRRRAAPSTLSDNADSTTSTSSTNRGSTFQFFAQQKLKGTKAWTGNSVLVSTGLRELDNLLSATTGKHQGGQPLGSCLYLEQDRLTALSDCFIRYWCAEVRILIVFASHRF